MSPAAPLPPMLSIAGSDCCAGAGLQADLKAGLAMGAYPLTVLTCAVSEVPGLVEQIVPMSPSFVAGQMRLCMQHYPIAAVKTGMLYSPEIVEAVVAVLGEFAPTALVVDPVMIATAGEALMQQAAVALYERALIPKATLLTPNLDELCALSGGARPQNEEQLEQMAAQLAKRYGCAILAKGGHLEGSHCVDVLVEASGESHVWRRERILGVSTHGTGCTLSAAIAGRLACGQGLVQAVEQGLDYVAVAIAQSLKWGAVQGLHPQLCRQGFV